MTSLATVDNAYSELTPENGSRLHSGEAILGPVIVCIFELVRSQDRSPKGGDGHRRNGATPGSSKVRERWRTVLTRTFVCTVPLFRQLERFPDTSRTSPPGTVRTSTWSESGE